MKLTSLAMLTVTLTMTTGLALAQPGPRADRCRAGASAPAADCPNGPGAGPRSMGPGARWGKDFTPGWSLMTPAEQQQHRDKMHSAKTYEECKAYRDQHHEQMVARAKEKGRTLPAQPRRDACAGLKVVQK